MNNPGQVGRAGRGRRFRISAFLSVACILILEGVAAGAKIPTCTKAELQDRNQWSLQNLSNPNNALPFSFTYGQKDSANLLASWAAKTESWTIDRFRTGRTHTWTDSSSGLQVRCVSVEYSDYAAVEWTVYFKNTGTQNTAMLENVQGLDTSFIRGIEGEFVLHGIKGDFCTADSYEPYQTYLVSGMLKKFSPPDYSGKSCDGPKGWPYYNLQIPGNGGVILAVGWPGQWASAFKRDAGQKLRVTAGQQLTRLVLQPGEEIRTPLIALLFWKGDDVVRAQNVWRRWYMAHNTPRVNGETQPPIAQIQVGGDRGNISYVKSFLDAGIKPDLCWRDAGGGHTWYPSGDGPYKGNDTWLNTGTWEVDKTKYPEGFKPFGDWVRSKGMQFLLWFEPERVGDPNSWLAKNHPEWMLRESSHGSILNLGNPAALNWLISHIDGLIKSQGLDWYREDMNGGGPLPAWRKTDAPDRQGITENLYVQGHLAFWDELRRRHPGLRIDSCASGGRRNDLETMRRAVPLLRSDFQFPDMKGVIEGNQGHTYGLSSWLPFQGTGCYIYEPYALRSFYLPSFGMGGLNKQSLAAQKKAYAECARIAPLMLADYYPLTPYNLQPDKWIAWQFSRPERGDGAIQAFRHSRCENEDVVLKLKGLEPSARYRIENLDSPSTQTVSGKELMRKGLRVHSAEKPGSAILIYSRAR